MTGILTRERCKNIDLNGNIILKMDNETRLLIAIRKNWRRLYNGNTDIGLSMNKIIGNNGEFGFSYP